MRSRLATAGMVACLLVPAACTGDPTSSEASPTGSTSTGVTQSPTSEGPRVSDPPTKSAPGGGEVLRPHGFRQLRLGMSKKAALRTELISVGDTTGKCTSFHLRYGEDASRVVHGYFTRGRGLSIINGQRGMHTSAGIGLGTSRSVLQNSYAHMVGSPEFLTATVSDRSVYYFVGKDDSITAFGLALAGDPCLRQGLD